MARGDHIEVDRPGFQHHGIDLGDGTVVHFTGEPMRKTHAQVQRTAWSEFLRDSHRYRKVEYKEPTYSPDAICLRALRLVGTTGYNLHSQNCEHFGRFCVTGTARSLQVEKAKKRVLSISRRGANNPWLFLAGPAVEAALRVGAAIGTMAAGVFATPDRAPVYPETPSTLFHYGDLYLSTATGPMLVLEHGPVRRLDNGSPVTAIPPDTRPHGALYLDDLLVAHHVTDTTVDRVMAGDVARRWSGTYYATAYGFMYWDGLAGVWRANPSAVDAAPPPPGDVRAMAYAYLGANGAVSFRARSGWSTTAGNQTVPEQVRVDDVRFLFG